MSTRSTFHLIGRCLKQKIFWCFLVIAVTWLAMLFCHSYATGLTMTIFVAVAVYGVIDEFLHIWTTEPPLSRTPTSDVI